MATTTTNSGPPPWAVPYWQDYLSRAQDVANTEYNQSPSQYVGPNQALQTAWQMGTDRATGGSPFMQTGGNYFQNLMGGDYLGRDATRNQNANVRNPYTGMNNPYLNQSIQNAQGDVVKAWNDVAKPSWDNRMGNSGSFGNAGVMQAGANAQSELQRNLGRIATDMRMGAYGLGANLAENQANRQFTSGENFAGRQDTIGSMERQFQNAGLGFTLPFANQAYTDANWMMNVGNQMQGFDQRQADQNYNWWQESQNYPRQQLDVMGRALTGNLGTTQTQNTPDPSRWSQYLGGALTGLGLYNAFGGGG